MQDETTSGTTLDDIAQIVAALPDAIKQVPIDKLNKILPALQQIMAYATKDDAPEPEEVTDDTAEEKPFTDEDPMTDEQKKKDEEKQFSDRKFMNAAMTMAKKLAQKEIKEFSEVVAQARNYLDDSYNYAGKTSKDIMRDAIKQTLGKPVNFADRDLSIAFKMLEMRPNLYADFGKGANEKQSLDQRIQQFLGE
jgi:hypothetical protein